MRPWCVLALCALALGRARATRCSHVSMQAPPDHARTTCLEFLTSIGQESLFLDKSVTDALPWCVSDTSSTGCGCPPGNRTQLRGTATTMYDPAHRGVYENMPYPHQSSARCDTECSMNYEAVMSSVNPKVCACWARIGCTFTERGIARLLTAKRNSVILVPDDLRTPVEEVRCDQSSITRLGVQLVCEKYMQTPTGASTACSAACNERGASCTPDCTLSCDVGYFKKANACSKCTECSAGTLEQHACTADSDATCVPFQTPLSTLPSSKVCSKGLHFDAVYGICVRCSGGMFSTSGGACEFCEKNHESARRAHADSCDKCPEGYTREAGERAGCEECPAGHTTDDAGECVRCAAGKASPTAFSGCVDCAPGKYAPIGSAKCRACPGQKVPTRDASKCVACSAKQQGINGVCTTCNVSPFLQCPVESVLDDCSTKNATGSCVCGCAPCDGNSPQLCAKCPFGQTMSSGACSYPSTWHQLRGTRNDQNFMLSWNGSVLHCFEFVDQYVSEVTLTRWLLDTNTQNKTSKPLAELALVWDLAKDVRTALRDATFQNACALGCTDGTQWWKTGIGWACLPCDGEFCNTTKINQCDVDIALGEFQVLDSMIAGNAGSQVQQNV